MSSEQIEAIIWAMLRIENEIPRLETIIAAPITNEAEKLMLQQTLEIHKKHFETFKQMLNN